MNSFSLEFTVCLHNYNCMHEEVSVMKNKQRRRRLLFLLAVSLGLGCVMVGNQVFDGYFLSTNTHAVTLGQISFEQIEELLEKGDRPVHIYSPKGTLLDTIYSLNEYQKLFFEEGSPVEGGQEIGYSTEEEMLEGLDPLVVLGDVSGQASPVSLKEQIPRTDTLEIVAPERKISDRIEEVRPQTPSQKTVT